MDCRPSSKVKFIEFSAPVIGASKRFVYSVMNKGLNSGLKIASSIRVYYERDSCFKRHHTAG